MQSQLDDLDFADDLAPLSHTQQQLHRKYQYYGGNARSIVPDKCVKLCDPRLNLSPEIRPEAIGGSSFDSFSR